MNQDPKSAHMREQEPGSVLILAALCVAWERRRDC